MWSRPRFEGGELTLSYSHHDRPPPLHPAQSWGLPQRDVSKKKKLSCMAVWVGGRKEKEDFKIKLDSEMCHRFSWQKTWPWESLGLCSFCDINNPTFSRMTFLLKGMGASLWVSHHGLQGSPGVTSLILSFCFR